MFTFFCSGGGFALEVAHIDAFHGDGDETDEHEGDGDAGPEDDREAAGQAFVYSEYHHGVGGYDLKCSEIAGRLGHGRNQAKQDHGDKAGSPGNFEIVGLRQAIDGDKLGRQIKSADSK